MLRPPVLNLSQGSSAPNHTHQTTHVAPTAAATRLVPCLLSFFFLLLPFEILVNSRKSVDN